MGIEITPDYDKKQKCYYCGKRYASKKYSYRESWYGITQKHTFPISVNYIKIDVEIPKCRHCDSKHRIAFIPTFIIFVICFVIYAYLCIKHGGWTDHWYMILFLVFVDTLISLFVSAFIGTPIRKIINAIFYSDCKDEGDTEEYEVTKRLRKIGFSRNNPDGLGSQKRDLIELKKLDESLREIHKAGFKVSNQN